MPPFIFFFFLGMHDVECRALENKQNMKRTDVKMARQCMVNNKKLKEFTRYFMNEILSQRNDVPSFLSSHFFILFLYTS